MDFDQLLKNIIEIGDYLQGKTLAVVNRSMTIRNWCFGLFIVEYEQEGKDKAKFGERLIESLSVSLSEKGVKGASVTTLKLCRQFYLAYPEIGPTLSDQFDIDFNKIIQLSVITVTNSFGPTVSDQMTATDPKIVNHRKQVINRLSFSHFVEILQCDEPMKRLFYELECIRGNWSVRELRRQIGSLLYERTGLSRSKNELIRIENEKSDKVSPEQIIKDPYVFEFLGLSSHEVFHEKNLENALIDHLQEFLLELGRGFCFEARQKRITVDNEHFYVDLVFYHRLLKCHVLIELKTEKFSHSHVGQLNFYLNYFRKYEMAEGDNPPVGILLCTAKDAEHVEFATAGLDNRFFVSKYKLALPTEEELKVFIQKELDKR